MSYPSLNVIIGPGLRAAAVLTLAVLALVLLLGAGAQIFASMACGEMAELNAEFIYRYSPFNGCLVRLPSGDWWPAGQVLRVVRS